MNFPNISPPEYPLEEELEDNSITSTFEDGTVQSRKKFTRSRTTWKLTWGAMPQDEWDTLKNFIKNQCHFQAVVFDWNDPFGGGTHSVRVKSVSASLTSVNYWNIELELQEA